MKKILCSLVILSLLLALPLPARAAEFSVDRHATFYGMSRSWYQGYTPTIQNHTMTLCLPLAAEHCVGDITVSFALDDPYVFLLASAPREITVSPSGGIYPVKLTLPLERYRRNGDYPATITIRGTDETGKELVETIPYTLRIRDGYNSHESLQPVISDVTGELSPGSNGNLTMTITNPTTTLSMTQCVVSVTDATGDILMAGAHQAELGEILPGQSQTVSLPMTVTGNASVSPHTLEVKLSCRVLGQASEWTESFTLPVTQVIRLEQGGVQLPTAIAGELAGLTLPLMNMGKGELQNVLVKLEMPDVLDAQSVLVGTLAAGETKQAKLTFTPSKDSAGTHSGKVYVTCEDAYGNSFSQTLEVNLTVDPPLPQEVAQPEEETKSIFSGTTVLMILCILLAAGLVLQGTLLTRKLRRLEEERL